MLYPAHVDGLGKFIYKPGISTMRSRYWILSVDLQPCSVIYPSNDKFYRYTLIKLKWHFIFDIFNLIKKVIWMRECVLNENKALYKFYLYLRRFVKNFRNSSYCYFFRCVLFWIKSISFAFLICSKCLRVYLFTGGFIIYVNFCVFVLN